MKQNFKKISEAKLRGKKKKNKLINLLTSILVAFEHDKMKGKSRSPQELTVGEKQQQNNAATLRIESFENSKCFRNITGSRFSLFANQIIKLLTKRF